MARQLRIGDRVKLVSSGMLKGRFGTVKSTDHFASWVILDDAIEITSGCRIKSDWFRNQDLRAVKSSPRH